MSLLTDCCWCNSTMWFTTGHWLSAVSKVFLAPSWDVYNNHWPLSDKRKLILLGPVKCYCKWPIPQWLWMPQNCNENASLLFWITSWLLWNYKWEMAQNTNSDFLTPCTALWVNHRAGLEKCDISRQSFSIEQFEFVDAKICFMCECSHWWRCWSCWWKGWFNYQH